MKLLLPKNIFSEIFLSAITAVKEIDAEFLPSALLSKKIIDEPVSVALIPTLDLISNRELFVSPDIGMSFDGPISNALIYFKHGDESLNELILSGDVSTNEVILSKIIFKELYNLDISVSLNRSDETTIDKNYLIVGSENFEKNKFADGITLTEEVNELINAPYVNYILASASDETLKEFVSIYKNKIADPTAVDLAAIAKGRSQLAMEFIISNIHHLVMSFEEQDVEGIKLLLQLPYYHGIIKEMIDVKFIS